MSTGQPDPGPSRPLAGRRVFLSASIPDRETWRGKYDWDPLEITDAVVAGVAAIWTEGGKILYGGHPAISPLLLRVAQDFRPEADESADGEPLVTVYQSSLYQDRIPEETLNLQAAGLGRIRFIEAVPGDSPRRGQNTASLLRMRMEMLSPQNDPAFAIFIGGMDGIEVEYRAYRERFPGRPVYPIGAPGGVARELADTVQGSPEYVRVDPEALRESAEYGALMDDILADAITRIA